MFLPSQPLLLGYWEAVLATVAAGCQKPPKWETLACVKCALEHGTNFLHTPDSHELYIGGHCLFSGRDVMGNRRDFMTVRFSVASAGRQDLLTHWIAQNQVQATTSSRELLSRLVEPPESWRT